MPRTLARALLVVCLLLAMPAASTTALRRTDDVQPRSVSTWDRHGDDDAGDDDGGGDGDHSGPGGGDRTPVSVTGAIPSGATIVRILDDDGFSPSTLIIDAGTTVTFVNQHHDQHSATSGAFDTGRIDPGATASVTFETPGSYPFTCIVHPEMHGTIEVRDASGVVPSPTPRPSVPPASAATQDVRIIDFGFEPPTSTVAVGTTVRWTVSQESPHTVTAADGSFDSGILDVGATFEHTFTAPGSYAFACRLHPQMQGTIVVDGSLPPVPSQPAGSLAP